MSAPLEPIEPSATQNNGAKPDGTHSHHAARYREHAFAGLRQAVEEHTQQASEQQDGGEHAEAKNRQSCETTRIKSRPRCVQTLSGVCLRGFGTIGHYWVWPTGKKYF